MLKPSIDDMLKICDSRYSLIVAVSKRARKIVDTEKTGENESNKEIENDYCEKEKPVISAIKDIYERRYRIVTDDTIGSL